MSSESGSLLINKLLAKQRNVKYGQEAFPYILDLMFNLLTCVFISLSPFTCIDSLTFFFFFFKFSVLLKSRPFIV